jgi:two-component system phosphate regulon response regulator PhoB
MVPDRVLVVEDEPILRSVLSTIFGRHGWDVTAVGTGQGALDAADSTFDVILLDLGLADVNGLDVCRQLRRRPATAQATIIVLTGRDDPRDVRDGLAAGADEFVTKPFDLVGLMASVDRARRRNARSWRDSPASRGVAT